LIIAAIFVDLNEVSRLSRLGGNSTYIRCFNAYLYALTRRLVSVVSCALYRDNLNFFCYLCLVNR